jgi:serine O-acetyltransferase
MTDERIGFLARVREDVAAAKLRDPAARSGLEIALLYPGLHAIWAHRVWHALWVRDARFVARAGSQVTRWLTGIEIHPGATIGRRFFIDHGMGVVVGETAEVGDDVMLYHGVTLGGRQREGGKRHPTLGDGVAVGAGAKILGPVFIGEGSVVGANAVVTKDAPADSVLVGVRAKPRARRVGEETRALLTTPEYHI